VLLAALTFFRMDCSFCNSGYGLILDEPNGAYVCSECGSVAPDDAVYHHSGVDAGSFDGIGFSAAGAGTARWVGRSQIWCGSRAVRGGSTYDRGFHFSERCRQWARICPPIPTGDLVLILDAAEALAAAETLAHTEDPIDIECLTKRQIKRVLQSIENVEPEHVIYKTRWEFHDQPFLPRTMMVYYERWQSIADSMRRRCLGHRGGRAYPLPEPLLLMRLRQMFAALQRPFEFVRHNVPCLLAKHNGLTTSRCHKLYGCRNNFLHLNSVLHSLVRIVVYQQHTAESADAAKHDLDAVFPYLITGRKHQRFLRRFRVMVWLAGWEYVPSAFRMNRDSKHYWDRLECARQGRKVV
jgi:hypothetical protein